MFTLLSSSPPPLSNPFRLIILRFCVIRRFARATAQPAHTVHIAARRVPSFSSRTVIRAMSSLPSFNAPDSAAATASVFVAAAPTGASATNGSVTPAAATAAAASAAPSALPTSLIPPSVLYRGEWWHSLCVPPVELRLDITLRNGQAFGWRRVDAAAVMEANSKATKKGRNKRARNDPAETKTEPGSSSSVAAATSTVAATATSSVTESSDPNVDVKLEAAAVKTELPLASSAPLPLVKSESMNESALPAPPAVAAAAAAGVSSYATPAAVPVLPSESDPVYIGVLGRSLIGLRQTDSDVYYREICAADSPTPLSQLDALLRDYLHLPSRCADHQSGMGAGAGTGTGTGTGAVTHADKLLSALYPQWGANTTRRFQFVASVFPGVRLLRQEPVECLFSFVCSSNNHISRIGAMLASLRSRYGERIRVPPEAMAQLGMGTEGQGEFYAFPTVDALCDATEAELRALGFGYRAKYIVASAALLRTRGGAAYLLDLRARPRSEVERALQDFPGVGPKVASCIALFALDQLGAVPVDTHVWQIALRDYAHAARARGLDLAAAKSLTPRIYQAVGDIFRDSFGAYAGWAHCILFLAELPEFKRTLAERGIDEIELEMEPTVAAAEPQLLASADDDGAATKEEQRDEDETTEDDEPADDHPNSKPPPARKIKPQKQNSASAVSKLAKRIAPELTHTFPQRKRSKGAQQS